MNKIWIELPAADTQAERQELCDKANAMLAKLVDDWKDGEGFAVNESKKVCGYQYVWHTWGGSYEELADSGKWLNLDLLSK